MPIACQWVRHELLALHAATCCPEQPIQSRKDPNICVAGAIAKRQINGCGGKLGFGGTMILFRHKLRWGLGALLLWGGCASGSKSLSSNTAKAERRAAETEQQTGKLPPQFSDLGAAAIPLADANDILQRYQEELLASRARLVMLQHLGEDALHLQVSVHGDQVMLSGLLPAEAQQKRAASAVSALQGVGKVITRFVSGTDESLEPSSSQNGQQTVQDTLFAVQNQLLAHQIELDLLRNLGSDALAIDVKVHEDIAELEGTVPSRDASRRARARVERFVDINKVENRLWVTPNPR